MLLKGIISALYGKHTVSVDEEIINVHTDPATLATLTAASGTEASASGSVAGTLGTVTHGTASFAGAESTEIATAKLQYTKVYPVYDTAEVILPERGGIVTEKLPIHKDFKEHQYLEVGDFVVVAVFNNDNNYNNAVIL